MSHPTADLPPHTIELHQAAGATRTAYVVYNPTAGSGLRRKRVEKDDLVARFLANGWNVGFVITRCAGDGTAAAARAVADGADVVVAMGGDGTVNEVVQALARGPVPLGIIPVGTINVLASELELPADPLAAVDTITRGTPRAIDLGLANGRYFTMMIGLGYDAEITNAIIPQLKQWGGPLAYWAASFQSFVTHKAVRARIAVTQGKKTRRYRRLIYMMVVSNTGLYAGGILKFTPDASISDGLLDVCLFRSKRWYRALFHIGLSFLGRFKGVPDVELFQTTKLVVRTARPFPYHLDGDPAGTTPVTIEIAPLGLSVYAGQPGSAEPVVAARPEA